MKRQMSFLQGARLAVASALLLAESAALAEDAAWQDAISQLAAEKTRAETCVSIFKRHTDAGGAQYSLGELSYSDAKAEIDGGIAALAVALVKGEDVADFETIVAQLSRGFSGRKAFCAKAVASLPESDDNEKLPVGDLLKVFASAIDVAGKIYIFKEEQRTGIRRTISDQLEAEKWRDFGSIEP